MRSGQALNIGFSNCGFSPESIAVFEFVFDFYGIIDTDGRVVNLTGSVFERTGTDPSLLIGQVFCETAFWQSSELTGKLLEQAISEAGSGKSTKISLDFRVSADEKEAMEVFVQPILREGRNTEIFIAGESIGRRPIPLDGEDATSSHLLFAAENAEIGLWFWDFAEDRIYATPRCNELFGLPSYGNFCYDDYREAIHPEDREFVDGFVSASRVNGTRYEEEFRVILPNGLTEWICSEGRSFLDDHGRPLRMTGIVQKITEQKLAGAELASAHEREKKAREEAVEANRSKDLFLQFVSHELRSPLNAIMGWTSILLTKELDEPTRRNGLETIERSAKFQAKLINDLVDSARVASGRIRLEYRPTNLYDIVRDTWQAQKPSADAKNIELNFSSTSEKIPLFGDSNRLNQVFANLISNAIKFTPEGGRVSVEIETLADSVKVYVSDSGRGLEPAAIPFIFKQFSQGSIDQTKPNVGLGLGLSIVKILVSKHGGLVHAESDGAGKGSKFTVTLPYAEGAVLESPAEETAANEKRHRLEGLEIVIVEDDADSREVLELFLSQSGAVVKSFSSVRSAVEAIEKGEERPDVIISDLGMPDEDGFTLIRRLRSLAPEAGGNIPALALSAFTAVESREKALTLGFDKYCTKPFEHDSLVMDILELTARNGAHTMPTPDGESSASPGHA
ncbi:MAG TPA: ATP-binding protein [Pyrinomonadaceae bacterium]|nr:ATP-binding protein [Pyrinomonadaceae bacterium]